MQIDQVLHTDGCDAVSLSVICDSRWRIRRQNGHRDQAGTLPPGNFTAGARARIPTI